MDNVFKLDDYRTPADPAPEPSLGGDTSKGHAPGDSPVRGDGFYIDVDRGPGGTDYVASEYDWIDYDEDGDTVVPTLRAFKRGYGGVEFSFELEYHRDYCEEGHDMSECDCEDGWEPYDSELYHAESYDLDCESGYGYACKAFDKSTIDSFKERVRALDGQAERRG